MLDQWSSKKARSESGGGDSGPTAPESAALANPESSKLSAGQRLASQPSSPRGGAEIWPAETAGLLVNTKCLGESRLGILRLGLRFA